MAADSDTSAARYYNLQGIEVDASHLAPGIYIVRQGNKSRKTLVADHRSLPNKNCARPGTQFFTFFICSICLQN